MNILDLSKTVGAINGRQDRATVHSIDGNKVNLQFRGSSTIVRGVEILGDPAFASVGAEVAVLWTGRRPYVVAGGNATTVISNLQVMWDNIVDKPSTFPPATHTHSAYDNLSSEGKIGTGAGQVAAGNHTHDGVGSDADTVDGAHAGNLSGNVALNNGTLNTNLNADMLDGYHAGNSSGQIAVANGTKVTDLNADKLDGYHAPANAGYTPSWTASVTNPSIGNGTLNGNYVTFGVLTFFTIYLYSGSTTSWGNGTYSIGLPATHVGYACIANVHVYDSSAAAFYERFAVINYNTNVISSFAQLDNGATLGTLTHNSPITWASGDRIFIHGFIITG